MGVVKQIWVALTGTLAWRIPRRARHLLWAFSRAELGSALDMLAAVEATERRDLRKKYFRHAMDEWRHSVIFREQAQSMGPTDAELAGRDEAGMLVENGIVGGRTLFERLGERDFLAFVYVAEGDAVEHFEVYHRLRLPNAGTLAAMDGILKDEVFHVTYSRAELDRMAQGGQGKEARRAILRTRWNRLKERWMRLSRDIGAVTSAVWLTALYLLVIWPFRLIARLDGGGWQVPPVEPRDRLLAARSEA